jgi:diacylglycerol kinase (ATP)
VARTAGLVYNPGSGRQRDRFHSITRMVDALRQQGIAVTPRTTAGPADATRLAAEALALGVDLVIVHGGDGTVNEAIQAVVGTPTPLAVWPSGTSNVLARELGLPGSLDLIARVIATGAIRRVSVGRAGERYFLLMAGVGLDADMLRSVHPGLKRLTGEGAYWMAGLRQLTDWNPVPFLVETEGDRHRATFAVVANAASYGGGLRFARGAHGRRSARPVSLRLDRAPSVRPLPGRRVQRLAHRPAWRDLREDAAGGRPRAGQPSGAGRRRAARPAAGQLRLYTGRPLSGGSPEVVTLGVV